jgi:4-hydroxyproline epimerase
MALLVAREELQVGDKYVSESIISSQFVGTIEDLVKVGDYDAIIPSIEGWAKITGSNTITIDEGDDPYAFGFQVI